MNYESLYQQFKWKQLHEKQVQQQEMARIQSMCNEPKININSTGILLKRTMQILDQFPDQDIINLQTSIPILQAVSILQVLKSVAEAKSKLNDGHDVVQTRLRCEAQFLYHLWNLIDQQQIQCRELKQLISLLQSKKKNELKFILSQTYPDQQRVQNLVRSWVVLTANQQYYKHVSKPSNSKIHQNNQNKQNITSQFDPLSSQNYQSNLSYNVHLNKIEKLNRSGQLGSPIYEKSKSGSKNGIPIEGQQKYLSNQFVYTCQLNPYQQKQLIERLYKNDIYRQRQQQKKQKQEQREKQALKQCTFKPNLINRGKSANCKSQNQIRGYDKAINRLKAGNQKNKITKQMRQYKPVGENYERLKQKGLNPPKFLDRKKKEEQKILFIISFDLGRHKTNVKIRQNDTEDSVADRICKIYSLKKQFYDQIREIVRNQLDAYYEQLEQLQNGAQGPSQQVF